MIKETVEITNPTGLHTRPGQRFVVKAKEFSCEITVKKDNKEASAKSLLKMLKLGINEGSKIEIICDGEDEQKAMDELKLFISTLVE